MISPEAREQSTADNVSKDSSEVITDIKKILIGKDLSEAEVIANSLALYRIIIEAATDGAEILKRDTYGWQVIDVPGL